jgi:hypothetical protein
VVCFTLFHFQTNPDSITSQVGGRS